MGDEIPRRARLDLMTPAERAIFDAVAVVEAAGCDVRLTDAVVLMAAARESVADYIDGIQRRRLVKVNEAPGCRCDCFSCTTGNHDCLYRPSVCPLNGAVGAEEDLPRERFHS